MVKHGGDWASFQKEYGSLPLDFSANISPLGLPTRVKAAAIQALETADRYPDPSCRQLRGKLADAYKTSAENIVCGNGAADLIHRLCAALRPAEALLTAPDFGEYEHALQGTGCGIRWLKRNEEDDFRLDAERISAALRGCALTFLSNPNNPTGILTEREELLHVLRACRENGCLLLLDECVMDLTESPEQFSLIPLLRQWPELVVLKAFTKTYAMAGLRLGYALCGSRNVAERLQASGQPWAVSHVAQAAGIAALDEDEYVLHLRKLLSLQRKKLAEGLKGLGIEPVSGEANYLLFHSGDKALGEKLRRKGILMRDCSDYIGLGPGWYRVAVRTGQENDRLLRALREVL